MKGVIYKIQNLENQRVYVGATQDFSLRIKQHINLANKGSNSFLFYPELKAKPEAFCFQMLETQVGQERLRERESFWIIQLDAIKNGYNQCIYAANEKLSPSDIEEIKGFLRDKNVKFSEIAKVFGIDESTVSDINRGESWFDESESYPIRANTVKRKKLTMDELTEIHALLAHSKLSFGDIARMFGWSSESVIRKINAGNYSSQLVEGAIYPIRSVDSRKGKRR